MIRLVQLKHPGQGQRLATVEGNKLCLLAGIDSSYTFAQEAITRGKTLAQAVSDVLSAESLGYDSIYRGESDWRLLPPFDHPDEPARCLVAGTGLTHKKSADNRQAMHANTAQISDSMRMYQWGVEGGRPAPGEIGFQPEWFYKGCGTILRAHGRAAGLFPTALAWTVARRRRRRALT